MLVIIATKQTTTNKLTKNLQELLKHTHTHTHTQTKPNNNYKNNGNNSSFHEKREWLDFISMYNWQPENREKMKYRHMHQ